MRVEQYVSDILTTGGHPTSFPTDLDIPKELVDYCWKLYAEGEKGGRERGVNLYLKQGKLDIGAKVFEGTATGININSDATNDNFGDLHCHPSSSIGHVDGYAAHSPEDFLALRNNIGQTCIYPVRGIGNPYLCCDLPIRPFQPGRKTNRKYWAWC